MTLPNRVHTLTRTLPRAKGFDRPKRFTTQAGIVDRVGDPTFLTPDLYNQRPNTTVRRGQYPAYWNKIGYWKDTTEEEFLNYRWQVSRSQKRY